MKNAVKSREYIRAGILLLCLFLLALCALCACTKAPDPVDGTDTEGDSGTQTDPPESLTEVLTLLPADSEAPTEPAELLPTADDLDPEAAYGGLVITSFYATGSIPDRALCAASYIELFNGGDDDLPLKGVALYVSNGGGAYEEYRFGFGDVIPARGCFLIRGRDAKGVHEDVLSVDRYDTVFPLTLDAKDVRLVLAPAGAAPDADSALAAVEGIYAYVSSNQRDAADTCHYVNDLSANKLARKKADTDKLDYQTINLTRTSATVLEQITPRTTAGRVNPAVKSLIPEVTFSAPSGVYETGFDLELSAPEGWTVYYTVNGGDPRQTAWTVGTGAVRYTSPIHLKDTTAMTWGTLTKAAATYLGWTYYPLASTFPGAATIRAYAKNDEDGTVTNTVTRTYFIGTEYTTWNMDMVNVSVIPDEFIGPHGIYLNNTPEHNHISAYVEYFDPAGQGVYAGWTEIALNGRGSLGMRQKSFRILFKSEPMGADGELENLGTFAYDLFGTYAQQTPDGERVTWNKHLLLRNGGGDNSGCTISRSHIGDAYIQRINRFLIPDDMAYAPVMVFVNGEFFGLYNARDRLDVKYFSLKYGVPEEDLAVLEAPYPIQNGQWVLGADFLVVSGTEDAADPFNRLVEYVRTHDMSNPVQYAYVCAQLDVPGLIDQFCGQMYLCCSDWPNNNVKVWRCTDPSVMDTKWHFTYVDTDHGCGLNSTYRDNLMWCISDGSKLGILMNHLMNNNEFRTLFIRRYIWCTEVYYNPARLEAELNELVARIQPVMQYQLDRWRVTDGSTTTYEIWWHYIEVIREFVHQRPAYVKEQIKAWAGLNEAMYQSHLEKAIESWGERVG